MLWKENMSAPSSTNRNDAPPGRHSRDDPSATGRLLRLFSTCRRLLLFVLFPLSALEDHHVGPGGLCELIEFSFADMLHVDPEIEVVDANNPEARFLFAGFNFAPSRERRW